MCNEETGGPCEEFEPGELQQCPGDKSSGCLISKLTIGDVTGPGKYTRSCSGSKPFPCRDYQGDQDEEVCSCYHCYSVSLIVPHSLYMSVCVGVMVVTRTGPVLVMTPPTLHPTLGMVSR